MAVANGTVSLVLDPATNKPVLSFTPEANFNGDVSFTYTVTDAAAGESLTRTVTVTVAAVNDAPVNTVPGPQVVDEDVPTPITGKRSPEDGMVRVSSGSAIARDSRWAPCSA